MVKRYGETRRGLRRWPSQWREKQNSCSSQGEKYVTMYTWSYFGFWESDRKRWDEVWLGERERWRGVMVGDGKGRTDSRWTLRIRPIDTSKRERNEPEYHGMWSHLRIFFVFLALLRKKLHCYLYFNSSYCVYVLPFGLYSFLLVLSSDSNYTVIHSLPSLSVHLT